jgi:hypothetical protein
MSRRAVPPFSFGATGRPQLGERKPARPDLGRIWLRLLVLVCLAALYLAPALRDWAGGSPAVVQEASAATPFAPLRRQLAAWLLAPPASTAILAIGCGGVVVLVGELVLAAAWLAIQRRSLDRVEPIYVRVRPLRPQSRKGARSNADPAELWRGLHAAIRGAAAQSGPRPWVAFTLHAGPDEPAAPGALYAGGAGPGAARTPRAAPAVRLSLPRPRALGRRPLAPIVPAAAADIQDACQSLKRALVKAVLGQDAETLVDEAPDPLARALRPGAVVCWQDLTLALPPHFPIRTPGAVDSDTLGPLAAALRPPPGVICTEIQVVAQPRDDISAQTPWRVFARRHYASLRQKPQPAATAEAAALEAKLAGESYDVSVRLVVVAQDRSHLAAARAALAELRSAFGQYQLRHAGRTQHFRSAGLPAVRFATVPRAGGSKLAVRLLPLGAPCTALAQVLNRAPRIALPPALLLPVRLWAAPLILSCAEAAGLWHLPDVALKTLIDWLPNRHLPAQPHAFIPAGAADRVVLGYALRGDGTTAPVGPPLRALRQVLHLTAGMGAGKSRALANIARQLIPHGFIQLDGKGDDAAGSLAATTLAYVPLEDEPRLVIVDVLDAEWPVGLNPLHSIDASTPGGMTQAIGMILAVFARLDPETWGKSQGMQQYAQMGAALIAETVERPTLANLKQAIQDDAYRASLLARCANVEVKTFWEVTFPRLGEQQKSSRDALLRRLDNLMVDETTRYLVTQPLPTVDFLDCMERGRIVVIPLPHRALGGVAEFIGMLLLQAVMRVAFQRPGSDQTRATVPLIVDELQVFVGKGDSKDIRDAITQLRGFGIGGIYAHQTLAQLGELRDEMLTNSANRLILRTQEPDASAYARQFPTTDLTPADISGQHFDEHQYAVFAGGAGPPEICSLHPLPWPAPLDPDREIAQYDGPDWQAVLPAPDTARAPEERAAGAPSLEALIARLVYGKVDVPRVVTLLALLPEQEWNYLCERWDAIRTTQRAYIIANPGCVLPDESIAGSDPEETAYLRRQEQRKRRQQWLSRLETRTPRVLAAASYQRQRW